jgi:hypothetical protein
MLITLQVFSYLLIFQCSSDINNPAISRLDLTAMNSPILIYDSGNEESNERYSYLPKKKSLDFEENSSKMKKTGILEIDKNQSTSDDVASIQVENNTMHILEKSNRLSRKTHGKVEEFENDRDADKDKSEEKCTSQTSEKLVTEVCLSQSLDDIPIFNTIGLNDNNQAKIVNREYFDMKLTESDRLSDIQVYSDLIEFIAKLIYFRSSFKQYLDSFMGKDIQNRYIDQILNNAIQNLPKNEQNLFYLPNSKVIIRDIMLLAYITLDFNQKNECYIREVLRKKYHAVTQMTFRQRRNIDELNLELKNKKLSNQERSKLEEKIKAKMNLISDLEYQRTNLSKRPSINLISNYAKFTSNFGSRFNNFTARWITIFHSLFKIVHYYDQNLKEIVGDHLNELRCPIFYQNREILMKQRSSNIDESSLTFVILDWVFFFFSPEFLRLLDQDNEGASKLLSRLSALIFILLNEPDTVKTILSKKETYYKWIDNLESCFKSQKYLSSAANIFNVFYDKVKQYDGSINISERHFQSQF